MTTQKDDLVFDIQELQTEIDEHVRKINQLKSIIQVKEQQLTEHEDLKSAMEELRIEMKANTELIDRVCNTLERNNEKIKEIFQNVEKLRKKNA